MTDKALIIIGTGLAGYKLAQAWRKLDSHTPLQLFTLDNGEYYMKPVLSNALTNRKTVEMIPLATVDEMRSQLNATIFTHTRVESVDINQQHIVANGQAYPYSNLVFACGGEQITPNIAGSGGADIFSVNSLTDYGEFIHCLQPQQHIAIIGAGFIGCEFANDLNNTGYRVSVIAASPYPLDKYIPPAAGQFLQTTLAREGVRWYTEQSVTAVDKTDDGFIITLHDDTTIVADHVLSSVGLRANTQLAAASGIRVDKGIVTDELLATSANHVYALGDCAEIAGEMKQFVAPIKHSAAALAQTLNGQQTPIFFPPLPITLKTTSCPIAMVNSQQDKPGRWQIQATDSEIKALRYNDNDALVGFVLAGTSKALLQERQALVQQITVNQSSPTN